MKATQNVIQQGVMDLGVLKVSAKSKAVVLAGAIAAEVNGHGKAELRAIGAGAVNQAIKAVAIARGLTISNGVNLICTPSFSDVVVNGETITAIKLIVHPLQ